MVQGPPFGAGAHVLCDLGKSLPSSGPQIQHWYTEGRTWFLLRPGAAAGSGANQGALAAVQAPSPLRLQVSVFA